MATRTGRWGGRGAYGSEPAGRWEMGGEKRLLAGMIWRVSLSLSLGVFLPLSVLSLNCSLDCQCKYLAHFLDLSYLAWCVSVACVYFSYCKRCTSLILSLFLEKLYPIWKAFPTHWAVTFPSKAWDKLWELRTFS